MARKRRRFNLAAALENVRYDEVPETIRGARGLRGGDGASGDGSDCCVPGERASRLKMCPGPKRVAHESFFALHLSARNRVLGVERIATGHLTGVEVHPREAFKGALLSNAAKIIVGHNHPSSGDSEPSPQDLVLTERLRQAGQLLGVPVADHIIVGADGCVSLHERGLL